MALKYDAYASPTMREPGGIVIVLVTEYVPAGK
jgi:hypothetical protein